MFMVLAIVTILAVALPPSPAMNVDVMVEPSGVERGQTTVLRFTLVNNLRMPRNATVVIGLPEGVVLVNATVPLGPGLPLVHEAILGAHEVVTGDIMLRVDANGPRTVAFAVSFPAGGEGSPIVTLERELGILVLDQLPIIPSVTFDDVPAFAPDAPAVFRLLGANADTEIAVEVMASCELPAGLGIPDDVPDTHLTVGPLTIEPNGTVEHDVALVSVRSGERWLSCRTAFRPTGTDDWIPIEEGVSVALHFPQFSPRASTPDEAGPDPATRSMMLKDVAVLRTRTEEAFFNGLLTDEQVAGMIASLDEGRTMVEGGSMDRAAERVNVVNATLENVAHQRLQGRVRAALAVIVVLLALTGTSFILRNRPEQGRCSYCGHVLGKNGSCTYCSDRYSRAPERPI
jgi:hypothetical protein